VAAAAAQITTEADFERAVLERSREVGVVVDFWAPWCAPCRTLGPRLERAVREQAGAVELVAIDVDRAPGLAQRFGARSIPLVLGFKGGQLVAEFVGAQPEAVVRRFVAALLPSEADRAVRAAAEHEARGDPVAAEARLRAALDSEPRHGPALLALARLLGSRGEPAEALSLLERVPPGSPLAPQAEHLAAELRTRQGDAGDEAALRARLAADPGDLAARLALGRSLAGASRFEEALAELLEGVRRDPGFEEQAARRAMLDIFAVLGPEHPATQRFRAALARALFR
jgi:putative thioredoxin